MKNNLDCALSSVPKELLQDMVTQLMRDRVKRILQEDDMLENITDAVRKEFDKQMAGQIPGIVQRYLKKSGSKMVEDSVDAYIDDEGIPTKAYNIMVAEIGKFVARAFKRGVK